MNHQFSRIAYACAVVVLALGCRTTRNEPEQSKPLAETDDRSSAKTNALIDIDDRLESHINDVIAMARETMRPADGIWTDEAKEALLHAVFDATGGDRPGSGIRIGIGNIGPEVSVLSKLEGWFRTELDPTRNEMAVLSFAESRYKDNVIGIVAGKVMSHKTQAAADHSIAPVVRLAGTLVGIDKFGHFFAQGYWYWRAKLDSLRLRCEYGAYMEGNPALFEERHRRYRTMAQVWIPGFRFGYFGSWATGVVSFADGEANEAGYLFYQRLFQDPEGYRFQVATFKDHIPLMNEEINPNLYTNGIVVERETSPAERPQDSCFRYFPNR